MPWIWVSVRGSALFGLAGLVLALVIVALPLYYFAAKRKRDRDYQRKLDEWERLVEPNKYLDRHRKD